MDGKLEGWCGIQPDDHGFELAIVLSQRAWGLGIAVFRILMGWASEFGHTEVVFHLLGSRPKYRSLARMARKVHQSELLRRRFITYHLLVAAHSGSWSPLCLALGCALSRFRSTPTAHITALKDFRLGYQMLHKGQQVPLLYSIKARKTA